MRLFILYKLQLEIINFLYKNFNTPFDVSKLDTLPKVEIAYMYVGVSASAINAFINDKIDGLIIAASGNGTFNKSILQAIDTAVKRGIAVVRSSRVTSGRVT